MRILDLIKKNRSYRRFYEDTPIKQEELELMVEAARFSASSRNVQPLKFILSNSPELNEQVFPNLAWAGYLTDWDGPTKGERPSGYIIMVHDKSISATYSCDNGIMAQSMLLQATELGYGGCMIASIKKDELKRIFSLNDTLEIIMVIALGKPKEIVVIDDIKDNDFRYFRDNDKIHHVPKRSLNELILTNK